MCRIGFVAFTPKVKAALRQETISAVLDNSWKLGNRDGVGYVSFDPEQAIVERSLAIENLNTEAATLPFNLLHVRYATTPKTLENTHPMAADGAYLVHNGIVRPTKASREVLEKALTTTCDSELILRAYLASERSLAKALPLLNGSANVMLWDSTRKVLSLYSETKPFCVWRQNGKLVICQETDQTKAVVVAGLGCPYESAELEDGKVYEIPLSDPNVDWQKALVKAAEAGVETELSSDVYGNYRRPIDYGEFNGATLFNGATSHTRGGQIWYSYKDDKGNWHTVDETSHHAVSECDIEAHPRARAKLDAPLIKVEEV